MRDTHYIVQTAQSPSSSRWSRRYGRIAVLEVDLGLNRVAMISPRARGVTRVVETWDNLVIGSSAWDEALDAAHALVKDLDASSGESA